MPIIDPADVALLDPGALLRSYVQSQHHFGLQVRKLAQVFDRCDKVLDRSALLQVIARPNWHISYSAGQNSEAFRAAMAGALERVGATFTFFRHGAELPAAPDAIVLTHHTRGRRRHGWHYKMAYLPFMFHMDRSGYSGWSDFRAVKRAEIEAQDQDAADAFFARTVPAILEAGITKHPQGAVPPPEAGDFVFFALQVPNDSVIQLCFEDDYVAAMRRAMLAIRRAGETVVVKPHPFGRTPRVMAMLNAVAQEGVIVTEASIHALLPRARAVVTANSGVGFEALLHEKPVLCMAQADYGHAAVELPDSAAADQTLAAALGTDRRPFARKMLMAMMTRHQVDLRSAEAMDRQVLRLLSEYIMPPEGSGRRAAAVPPA